MLYSRLSVSTYSHERRQVISVRSVVRSYVLHVLAIVRSETGSLESGVVVGQVIIPSYKLRVSAVHPRLSFRDSFYDH